MAKDEKIFTLRIRADLLEYLKGRAEHNKRSIAKEIEFIVEKIKDKEQDIAKNDIKRIYNLLEKNGIPTEKITEDMLLQAYLQSDIELTRLPLNNFDFI